MLFFAAVKRLHPITTVAANAAINLRINGTIVKNSLHHVSVPKHFTSRRLMVAKPNHTTSPRNFETGSKPHLWRYAIPNALLVLAELLNDLVLHQAMRFPYEYWQLLDKSLLEQHLWESLLLLHSQPPMFNLVLGVLLKAGALLHVQPEFFASVMFGALGLATALFLFHLAMEWTRSIALASLACFLYFANPVTMEDRMPA